MVRVDEAGQNHEAFEIEHFIGGLRQFLRRADLFDEAITHEKTTLGNFPLTVVHRDDISILDEESRHI